MTKSVKRPCVAIACAVVCIGAAGWIVSTCARPSASGLADAKGMPGKAVKYDVDVRPKIAAYTIAPDLSNVELGRDAKDLRPDQRALLAGNGFVIMPGASQELYEYYLGNPAPFVTSDTLFHAYHVLLFDTLQSAEKVYLAPELAALARDAQEQMDSLYGKAPSSLQPAAKDALLFLSIARKLAEPKFSAHAVVRAEVDAEVKRIEAASQIGVVGGRKVDHTAYAPIAGREEDPALERYFRLNRFFTLRTIPFKTTRDAQTCALVATAIASAPRAAKAYERVTRVARFLTGEPEDPMPGDVLRVTKEVCGTSGLPEVLAKDDKAQALLTALLALPKPQVADQPQSKPGADAPLNWGMRVLAPGVTIRARAFQKIAETTGLPSGLDMAYVLGTDTGRSKSHAPLLANARKLLKERGAAFHGNIDLHSASMVVLSKLSGPWRDGYPQFMQSDAWRVKTANTQMAGWSEVEHDTFLYAKDNTLYLCAMMDEHRFAGYVEPVPEFYAALASLVHRTCTAFDELGIFDKLAGLRLRGTRREQEEKDLSHHPRIIVATKDHYKTLEGLLLKLKTMAEKELRNETFNKEETELLKRKLGLQLKRLAFNESTSPEPREPMSCIVRIAREYLKEEGLYVGVGRPMTILTIVPYAGKLHLSRGGVYSYYEFTRPLRQPLTDAAWKRMTMKPVTQQQVKPWLLGQNVVGNN